MLVQTILASMGNRDIIWLKPGDSIAQAARVMSENRIGACIVSTTGTDVAGILSERDIVRELGKRGSGILEDKIETIMTSKITTCTSLEPLDAVLQTMTDGRFRHLPVVEEGKLIGLISIGDAVKGRLSELSMEKDALEGMIMGH